jgi:hypothetical protein
MTVGEENKWSIFRRYSTNCKHDGAKLRQSYQVSTPPLAHFEV